jgi:hypothetical protein
MTGDGLRFAIRGAELAADEALAALDDPAIDAGRPARRGAGAGFRHEVRRQPAAAAAGRARHAGSASWPISARVAPGILRQMIRYAGDVAA